MKQLSSRTMKLSSNKTIRYFTISLFLSFILTSGFYKLFFKVNPIFAESATSITKNTDTHFSAGTASSTSVSGSGSSAVVQLSGTAGPNGTTYKKPVIIDNSTGGALTNYQVLVTIDTGALVTAGKLQSDCDDLRFLDADDSTALNYWIESGCNTSSTKVWVMVPSISATSSKTIYLYYGNASVDAGKSTPGTSSLPGFSCKSLLNAGVSSSNVYYIRPGNNSSDLIQVYCDMSTLTDGWTLVLQNNKALTTNPEPNWSNVVNIVNTTGTFGSTLSAFDLFLGVKWWNKIGNQARVDVGTTPSDITKRATYSSISLNSSLNYALTLGTETLYFGAGSAGIKSYHALSNYQLTTSDSDHDVYGANCANLYGGSPWWYGACWSGSFWGGGDGGSYQNASFWTGSSTDYHNYGAIWLRGDYALDSGQPSTSFGSESVALQSSGTWESPTDSNVIDTVWNGGWGDGTSGSTAFSATVANVGTNNTIAFAMRTATTANGLSSATYQTLGTANSGTTFTATKAQLDALGLATGTSRYVQVKATFAQTSGTNPQLDDFTISYLADNTAPETNATTAVMTKTNGGATVSSNGWTNDLSPYFSWTAGSDSQAGLKGYCLYLGTSSSGDPSSDKGLLGTSPVSTTGSTCQFIVSAVNIDFATTAYRGSTWLTSSSSSYYLNIKAIDNTNNIYASNTQFRFNFDNTSPSNPNYISLPSDFIATKAATLTWPTTGANAPADSNSGVAGLQYRFGSSGTWYGDSHSGTQDSTDLLTNDGSYNTDVTYDYPVISEGNNTIYVRVYDTAGNYTSTYVTGVLKVNVTAPSSPQSLSVTPSDATTNSYAFSWSAPSTYEGQASGITYCYTVNTLPTASTCTFTAAGVVSLSADAFATQPGTNTFYLVAKDEAGNINYDVYSSVTFTYSGTAPGIPANVDIADISTKSTSNWKLAVSWDAPSNVGAGVSSYKVYRSTTATTCSSSFSSFTYIGSTSGTSYSDTGLSQQYYYYCLKACDSANSCSASSSTVNAYPDGKFTTSAGLSSGPTVSSITTKKATITWATDRTADSRVQYGTSTGSYFTEEVSNSSHVTSHTITLTNLSAGTTYYYKAKYTDEDGNTGASSENTFTTDPAPVVKNVSAKSIGITNTILEFTVTSATKVKIYYGPTTSFGGLKEMSTSLIETTYTSDLTGLSDGTKYYYKIDTVDEENEEYQGTILDFETLPMPKISLATLHEAKGAATPTVLVTWDTNTAISSIVTFYPKSDPAKTRDEIDVNLKSGAHTMFVRNLIPNSDYLFIISGRDKIGTEAQSSTISYTTASDTRPPQISGLSVEADSTPMARSSDQQSTAQLIVAWNTDEPSTSQVEYGEGTGTTYNQKTQEDQSLTFNHLVVISGLTPSKVYHLRALSKDKAENFGNSIDTVTITPKAVDNALDLVISNLREAFGFLK